MGARRLVVESASLSLPAIAVHGGAGTWRLLEERGEEVRRPVHAALAGALEAGWDVLSRGGDALSAVVEAVALMEDSGLFNAGRGSVPTTAGAVEADASVMDGATRRFGGVCATTWPANPVRAALAVSGLGGGPAPVLLAGAGADEVAMQAGLAPMPFLGRKVVPSGTPPSTPPSTPPDATTGTVGAVAVGPSGGLAAATSTGGLAGQRPGRVGDSAVAGAGTWADETVAVSATGTGEAFILAGFARRVAWSLRGGSGLEASLVAAIDAVVEWGGTGGTIAITPGGRLSMVFMTPAMARGWRAGEGSSIEI
jgi:isoaspartyl peptidase/L-asparaginase-like protein (Ntn-hydrolase superfamily)